MTGGIFQSAYANLYRDLYRDKDYEQECDAIQGVLARYSDSAVRTILDLGCGTGGHLIPFAERGFDVVGVDISPDMLEQARRSASAADLQVDLHQADLRDFHLGRPADAVTMLFAVLGYQTSNEDALAALRSARSNLRKGGLLVFDVWYGPAVLTQRPEARTKKAVTEGGLEIRRRSTSTLDLTRSTCSVTFRVAASDEAGPMEEFEETHEVRYFFATELELMFDATGFALVHLSGFPDLERPADETTWQVLVVARAL